MKKRGRIVWSLPTWCFALLSFFPWMLFLEVPFSIHVFSLFLLPAVFQVFTFLTFVKLQAFYFILIYRHSKTIEISNTQNYFDLAEIHSPELFISSGSRLRG